MRSRDPKTPGSVPAYLLVLSLLVSMCLLCVASPVLAGNNPSAKAAVHVRAHNAKAGCNYGTIESCADIVTSEPGYSFDAFPVFFNLTEYQGCEFGMSWPTWSYGATFTNCSDLVIGSIENPGEGSSHTWLTCQSGVCVPCFLWLYADAAGQVCMVPHPISGVIDVLDCAESVDGAIATFCAGVYGGTGDDPCAAGPLCEVTPTTLDYGTVTVGEFSDLSFVLKNIGEGTLEGSVTTGCTQYSIQAGGGAYALGAGESVTVVIRFQPSVAGYDECTILTGADCSDVTCTGTGVIPPECDVSPTTLDFGTVTVGEFAEDTFTITNIGGGTLTGDPSEACPDYDIVGGGDAYALGNGESVVVTVRFTPGSSGLKECMVDAGTDCPGVACSGVGEELPECLVEPTALYFGPVDIDAPLEYLVFRITNVGGGLLEGEVTEACDEFGISDGGGAYSLAAGEFVDVTVAFDPATMGAKECIIETGAECANVNCSGTGTDELPECLVEPATLDFGPVDIDAPLEYLVFRITNVGGQLLEGEVTEACDEFSISDGGGAYSLAAGEFVDVTIAFDPATMGLKECTIETGAECANVTCSGTGTDELPECLVEPATLDFGSVDIDAGEVHLTFRITNVGGQLLEGEVTEACDEFFFVGGGGAYSLAAGEFVDVNVAFDPATVGLKECTIETGAECANVTCSGTGTDEPPECLVEPTTLDFGSVDIDAGEVHLTFRITNVGGQLLEGEVTETCDEFFFVGGGGAYSLANGDFVDVNVAFDPATIGLKECAIETGAECANVTCSGTGTDEPPECLVEPTTLDFGSVDIDAGEVHLTFRITNVGGQLLEGEVTETCDEFFFVGGGGAYSLANGEFVDVNVAFDPATVGLKECTIETGAECANVTCSGTGTDEPPECLVEPTTLDFGSVDIDAGEVHMTFRITNVGGQLLEGEVTEACDEFFFVGGGGAYSLANGDFVDVNVAFDPATVGLKECTIETGAECANVTCSGAGTDEPAECLVEPTTLEYGTVLVGNAVDQVFRITNIGGSLLEGEVSEACDDYEIIGGAGAYSLANGEFVDVNVRFQPSSGGLKECTIETGTECTNVACTGTGQEPTACDVSPTVLNFGTVTLGDFADLSFTITNTGGGTLSGEVTEACADFDIISGGGAYSLGAGEFVDVTVRFQPGTEGLKQCTVSTGTECADVSCSGTGELPPICDVAPSPLNFGTLMLGQYADLSFTIFNIGGGTLSGTVSETCPDFDIISGGGAYNLGAGEFVDVVVRFAPTTAGPAVCVVETGTECANVTCNGEGQEASRCDVIPTILGFGPVMVGNVADLSFTIMNGGGGVLSGEVTEACADFEIVSGGGPYDLAAGEYVDVVVLFRPSVIGPAECIIQTGTECADVLCMGLGDMPPICDVMPASLDFGDVLVGGYEDLSFTITNIGGRVLSGVVTEACDYFEILSGGGAYDLGAGEYVDVVVRFAPTLLGPAACTVETGAECADVACTGMGAEEPPVCAVDPIELDFGTIPVGDYTDLTFTITNTGGGILTGMVAETCDDFDILYGEGPYDLGAGDFVEVGVRFEPGSPGLKDCVIETGADCANVHCTGTGRGEGLMVYFDIKPGSCPNPLNVRSKGVLPAAVLGTETFDVMEIQLTSLRLVRDGVGDVMPLRWAYEDVGTPFMGEPCDCHEMDGDGLMDLTLKFDTEKLVTELGLQGMPDGDVELMIAGNTVNGEPLMGVDCVRLKGTKAQPDGNENDGLGFSRTESASDGTATEIEIPYYVEVGGHIYLEIFDVRGRTIKTLVDGDLGAGTYTAVWDKTGYAGEKVQSGVYFARLRRDSESETKKILIVN